MAEAATAVAQLHGKRNNKAGVKARYRAEAICRGAQWDSEVCRRFGVSWDQLTPAMMREALGEPKQPSVKARFRAEALYRGAPWLKAVCARFGVAEFMDLTRAQMQAAMADAAA
jgi:hypothetical protein